MTKKIAVIVGSLRKDSLNKKLALQLMKLAPKTLEMELIEIGDLPLYNSDLDEDEGSIPAAWSRFREQVKPCDGVLFVTPEYNRSVPGALKNAIDVGSRPYGHSVWGGKAGAVISASPGAIGGFGANNHLRQCFVFLDVPTMQQPEAYMGGAGSFFDEKGELIKEDTRKFLQHFVDSYAKWVSR